MLHLPLAQLTALADFWYMTPHLLCAGRPRGSNFGPRARLWVRLCSALGALLVSGRYFKLTLFNPRDCLSARVLQGHALEIYSCSGMAVRAPARRLGKALCGYRPIQGRANVGICMRRGGNEGPGSSNSPKLLVQGRDRLARV